MRFLITAVALAMLAGPTVGCVPTDSPPSASDDGAATVQALFDARQSGRVVEVRGVVDRLLPDDNDGSRHQRFIIRLASDQTLLIAHNIDLADPVPVAEADAVRIRGEYEWNPQGGLLHWTHHDPGGRRPGGWVEHRGRRYR